MANEDSRLETLRRRAQKIADDTASPRWVVWTSLGWRIEWFEPKGDASLFYRFDPQPGDAR